MEAISDKKLNLGEVDKIFNQGAQMMANKNIGHGFLDPGGGGSVDGGQVNAGHHGEAAQQDLLDGDGEDSHRGVDYAGYGGTVDGGTIAVATLVRKNI